MCVTCWMMIQRLVDFSVQSAYNLLEYEARSGLGEASNNHSSTIMWQAPWKVFHGMLFRISQQQRLDYFPKGFISSVNCEQCNEVPESSLHTLWSCPHAKKVWQLIEGINIIPQQPHQKSTDLFSWMLHHKNTISLKLFLIQSWQSWLHIYGKRFEEPGIQQPLQYIEVRRCMNATWLQKFHLSYCRKYTSQYGSPFSYLTSR